MKKEAFNLKDRIGRYIGMTAKAWKIYANQKLTQNGYDLTIEQAVILVHTWHDGGMNQQQISDIIDRDKTSTTRFIDVLEEANLVKRVHDKKDRRQNLIYTTAEGEKKCHEFLSIAMEIERELIEGINEADIEIFKKVSEMIFQNISKRI